MADVFISYDRTDRDRAQQLADVLASHSFSVWWDTSIVPGENFRQVLTEQLDAASCVLVLWSRASVASNWVIDEASDGLNRGVLVQALIDPVEPPHGFRSYQRADLTRWNGAPSAPELLQLLKGVSKISELTSPTPKPPPVPIAPVVAPARRPVKVLPIAWLTKSSQGRMGRRKFLWTAVTLLVAATTVFKGFIAGWINRLLPVGWRISHAHHPAKNRRLARKARPIWGETQLVVNLAAKPTTVHWPHPALFKVRYRVGAKNQVLSPADNLSGLIQMSEGARLNRSQAETILERLALRKLTNLGAGTNPPQSGDADMMALDAGFALLLSAKTLGVATRRTYELGARLICLRYPQDSGTAANHVADWLGSSAHEPWRARLLDRQQFHRWHASTVDPRTVRGFFRKLSGRVASAQRL